MKKGYFVLFVITILIACSTENTQVLGIKDNKWKLIEMTKDNQLYSPEVSHILIFQDDERYSLNLDVNSCYGSYKLVEPNGIDFMRGIPCTEICCDSQFSQDLISIFPKFTTYLIADGILILSGSNGKARFEPI